MSGSQRTIAGVKGTYIPGTPASWLAIGATPPPDNPQDALDDLAAVAAAGGGGATGPANAMAYYDGAGHNTGNGSLIVGLPDAYGRPQIHDYRFTARGVVHRLGAWGQDGDPNNVASEGFVTYGPNALGNGPDGAEGGMGFYEPSGYGVIQVIPGVNGGNPFYLCGFEDGGPAAPFGLDGFIVRSNAFDTLFQVRRSDGVTLLAKPALQEAGLSPVQGVAALGVAGVVVVAGSAVQAGTRIYLTAQEGPALTGSLQVTARVPGASFTVTSSAGAADAGVNVAWMLMGNA